MAGDLKDRRCMGLAAAIRPNVHALLRYQRRQHRAAAFAEPDARRTRRLAPAAQDHAVAVLQEAPLLLRARATFERMLNIAPKFPPAIRQLTLLYVEQAPDDPKAYEFATMARETNPADDQVAAALGKILCRRGDFAFAERLLTESLRSQSKDPSVHYHLGLAYRGTQQKAEGAKAFEKALQLAPTAPFATEAKRFLDELKKG